CRACLSRAGLGSYRREAMQGSIEAEYMTGAGRALFQLDLACRDALGSDDQLPGKADEVDGRELGARPLVAVVVEHAQPCRLELRIEVVADLVGLGIAALHVNQADVEGAQGQGPEMAGAAVGGLDEGAAEPRHADAVGAHLHRDQSTIGTLDFATHRLGVLGAEEENMADLDTAGGDAVIFWHLGGEAGGVMLLAGGCVFAGPGLNDRRKIALIVEISARRLELDQVPVTINLALP